MITNARPTLGFGAAICVVLLGSGCGSKPAPRSSSEIAPDPAVVVSPDTGPSALQLRLLAMKPATALPESSVESRLDDALEAYHQRTRSHRAYIAVDKPLYQPGETIWFRAFDLFSTELSGDAQSYGTSFQLVSPKGAVVLEKRVLTEEGAAANDFVLPDYVPGGEYVIQAATDQGTTVERTIIVSSYEPPRIKKKLEFLRKAYGAGDHVAAAVAMNRATGEALASHTITGLVVLDGVELARIPVKTDSAGKAVVRFDLPAQIAHGDGLLTVLVDDGGVTESIQKRIPITVKELQFAMFPEGGDLVAGLPGRVYFSAKNPIGKPADVEGQVRDDRGRVVARFRSYVNGFGRFEIVPERNRKYSVEITRPVGVTAHYDVPAAASKGCAMQALDDFDSERDDIRVAVWCSHERKVTATAVLREKRLGTTSARVEAGVPAVLSLPAPTADQGAVRVTLFDGGLKPLAERLIYRNRNADLKVKITADEKSYTPRGKVALDIETFGLDGRPVAADLAVSVVDDTVLSFADDKTAQLMARIYLESEMPGQKVEEPNFYFSTDPKASAGLDLVLGTQGWRRFDWKLVFVPPEPIAFGWDFTGEYWRDELGHYRVKKEKKDEEEAEEDENGPEDEGRGPFRPRKQGLAGKKVAGKVKAAEARGLDEPAPPPMAEPADIPMAGAEAVMLERRAFRNNKNFEIGGEADLRKRRIRDEDWGDGEVAQNQWGWAPAREFPVPNYAQRYDGPRVDFRETIFWQPRVKTDAQGKARVSFYLSDAVTSFRVAAEGVGQGGLPGRGESLVQSKLPVSLAVKMPLEVSAGDLILLPVTVANETDEAYQAHLDASFGAAFSLQGGGVPSEVELSPQQRKSFFYQLKVVGSGKQAEDGKMVVAVEAANLRDEVERTIKVVPLGFPQELSVAGTAKRGERQRHELYLSDVLASTMEAKMTMYPSPLATMVEGTEAIIREPTGCFEQASSANYPNIMILDYLDEHDAADPDLIERTQGMLDRGYNKLTGYESPEKGYEWFGGDPGHEALTAYGLMEFVDMTRVYDDVSKPMIERTARWLKSRRDGKGGYKRNPRALDSFGSASEEVTNAYITYALTEAGEKKLGAEIRRQTDVAKHVEDPYVLALAANTLVNVNAKSGAATSAVARLAEMQAEDGSFPGADHSITRSGGKALDIETTSLAAMAVMKARGANAPEVRRAVDWLNKNRDGFGSYGSTQSTVLALKTMSEYAAGARQTRASGVAAVFVNGHEAGRIAYEKGHQGALEFDLGEYLHKGKNVVEVELDSEEPLPYSMAVTYRSKLPETSKEAKVSVETMLAKDKVPMGETVRMKVRVRNLSAKGVPMALARVGLPGGLTFQTWQLKELKDKKLIDFYETRPREVILYFRSLAPKAVKEIDLELKAGVTGTFTGPASSAYLYYTDEYKHWADPLQVTVMR